MSYKENPYKYSLTYAYNTATGEFNNVHMDSNGGLQIIDAVHHLTHLGKFFYTGYYNAALGGSSNLDVLINTSDKEVHIRTQVTLNDKGAFFLYESPTISGNGTALTPVNAKRSSSNTPELSSFHTPSVSAVGTLLGVQVVTGGGPGGNAVGSGVTTNADLLVLAPNTSYLFRLTNQGSNAAAAVFIGFYEV